jgi:folate-binding protein YgfZ
MTLKIAGVTTLTCPPSSRYNHPMPSALEEYKIVEQGIGLISLQQATLRFQGTDSKEFLQGSLSNDIKQLKKGHGLRACHLTAKGKLIATLRLFEQEDGIWAFTSKMEAEHFKNAIKTLIFFSQTELADLSDQFAWIMGIGKQALPFAEQTLGLKTDLADLGHDRIHLSGIEMEAIHDLSWNYPAFLMMFPQEKKTDLFQILAKTQKPYPVAPIGEKTLEILRIESTIPSYGIDMDENTLPPEANLESYISYTKGCFIGQEVISRIKHYGHVNKLLVRLKLETKNPIEPVALVFVDEKEVGKVTSCAYSPKFDTPVALATVRREVAEVGKKVWVKTGEGNITAIVV